LLLDSLRYSPAGGFNPSLHLNSSATVMRPERVRARA
jgi:hypothetical protein